MARELSAVLDHVAQIGELDLEDVAPTSHVVEVTGALRADEPRACLPREVALAQAPAVGGDGFSFRAPRHERRRPPRAVRRAGGAAIAAGELSAERAVRRSTRARRSEADELNCFTWVAERGARRASRRARDRCARGCRWRSRTCSARRACPASRARASSRATCRPYTATVVERLHGGGRERCWRRPTRTSSRWAPRTRTRRSDRCSTRGIARACRAAPRAAARRRSPRGSRRGRWAPTPAARSASRPRCAGSSG